MENITRVSGHILTDGLSSNRPCVAQIISRAADQMTTRVEDSLFPVRPAGCCFGEEKKTFHRLQLAVSSSPITVFRFGCSSVPAPFQSSKPGYHTASTHHVHLWSSNGLWKSPYYRYCLIYTKVPTIEETQQFRQVFLSIKTRYVAMSHLKSMTA